MNLKEYQKIGEEIHKQGIFVGCNIIQFAKTSQVPINIAKENGLTVSSKVLEIGCGCCRVGYWFMNYIDPNCYYGIEPNEEMFNIGKDKIFGHLIDKKNPKFNHNDQFDLSVFNESYDMIIAFSIWSHATKYQIETVIKQLPQYKPCTFLGTMLFSKQDEEDYKGENWVGISHESKAKGVVKHSYDWFNKVCKDNDCELTILEETTVRQQWIKIKS